MKNSLGNPARGEAFYPRNKEIGKIYRTLKSETNIYLAAPRRVGKTSILRYLEEKPEEGYYFIYVITESIDNINEFFKVIYNEVISSDSISRIKKVIERVKDKKDKFLEIIDEAGPVKLKEAKEVDYHYLLTQLFIHFNKEVGTLVIMIDEFPQTIQNIIDKTGVEEAKTFLQLNRELRLDKNLLGKVNFIYTGSVSLFPMVEKVMDLNVINDTKTVDVPPLLREDAKKLINLLMYAGGRELNDASLEYIIDKLKWLIPFHIQLVQVEVLDILESGVEESKEVIEKAFNQIVCDSNKPQFDPYFTRLKKIFKANEYDFVIEILKITAQKDVISENEINDLKTKHKIIDLKNIISILESDGYIVKQDGNYYRYVSPLLQLWCKNKIC